MKPKPLEEKIKAAIARHPDWDDGKIANYGVKGVRVFQVKAVRAGEPIPAKVEEAPKDSVGFVSLERIIQKFDIRSAILRELGTIPKDKLISEVELCQRAAGTDKNRFRRTVENNEAEFRPLRIRLKLDEGEPKWYWGEKTTVEAAQRIRDL